MTRVLVSAASRYGATTEIAEAIAAELREQELEADLRAPEDVERVGAYDGVVLGSAVYTGHWLAAAMDFAERCSAELLERPVWLFSSGPVGDPSRKMVKAMGADTIDLPRLRELTAAQEHRIFAGRLDRADLRGIHRASLFFFRGLEGDFRDWNAISAWAGQIAAALRP